MTPENLFGIGLVAALTIGGVLKLLPRPRPPSSVFTCSRCGAVSAHDGRTVRAWRKGERHLVCSTCIGTDG